MKHARSSQSAVLSVVLAAACLSGEEGVFEPAFSPDAVDFERSKQIVDGKAEPADAERVRKALGFSTATNWEDQKWTLRAATGQESSVCAFLLVLKQPVAVGTVCVNPADMGSEKGSRTGGELWYLKPGAPVPSDIADATPWVKAEFATAAPYVRFALLPPGTKTQAFLYKDTRSGGEAQLCYWRFYSRRLFSVTPAARPFSDTTRGEDDPDALIKGQSWRGGDRGKPLSEKNAAWCMLAWDKPQKLGGVFLYSNASKFKLLSLDGADPSPALAPADAWKSIEFQLASDCKHTFQHWAYSFRWLSFAPVTTTAVKLQITGVEKGGAETWVSGLGAFIDLGDAPPPAAVAQEESAPFRIRCEWATDGEAAAAINSGDGVRVRNLYALQPRLKGPAEEPWDLKDENGRYVAPGTYRFQGICAPPVELRYGITPYPNVDQIWPDRRPWLIGHSGPHGWLSDHCGNWACTTRGDRVYSASAMAEAGVCLIECDLDGRKLWGQHDFGPWIGVDDLAADEKAVYVQAHGTVYRLDPETHASKKLFQWGGGGRPWQYRSMAARDGRIYMNFSEDSDSLLTNATSQENLDLERCVPVPPLKDDKHLLPFSLRLAGHVPGKQVDPRSTKPLGNGRLFLESTNEPRRTQYLVFAFKQPVALGSVVFPHSGGKDKISFSVLKPDAAYPPKPEVDGDWLAFADHGRAGWNCIAAPENVRTRALRVSFEDPEDLLDHKPWLARLEGMKLLRRRFANLYPTAKVRVNSGTVDATGAWDAQRPDSLGPDRPGVMVLEWPKTQKVRGLAIKEIEGATTEIDIWQGAGDVALDGGASDKKEPKPGWVRVATYKQKRRTACYQWEDNMFARYIDGYVDFGEEFETRAVRLRVTEAWLDNGEKGECRRADEPLEHGVHLTQSRIMKLDTRRCRILGVAPLQYLGGETPMEAAANKRIAVYDGETGKPIKEISAALGWHGLSFGPDGTLYGMAYDHKGIVRVDLDTGKLTPVVANIAPSVMTAGPDGLLYVWPWSNEGRDAIEVYDTQGKLVRKIGKPGGRQAGPWDPQRFGDVHRLTVDKNGSLWVIEAQDFPRRIVQYKTDGTFVKEILGNTNYGGAGTLNRYDKSRAYFGPMEFELDWTKHTSRLRGLMALRLETSDLVAVRAKERTYLVSTPLSMHDTQGRGIVYLYDDATGTVRLVAAFGDANGFGPLRASAIVDLLKGDVPRDYKFVWSDRNGNGALDADEVQFEKKGDSGRHGGVGRFDAELGCPGFGAYYFVKEFLANGAPVYDKRALKQPANVRLASGNFLALHRSVTEGARSENVVTDAEGRKLWGYPAHGGVSGLSVPGWTPGHVGTQFAIVGHETAGAGDLGECFVTHANTGQWFLWTADGLLAGQILRHKADPRARLFGPAEAAPGTRLDPLSASQEHFHGFFTRSEADGKHYLIAGFTHMSVIEVSGIEKFRRVSTEVKVTDDDLRRAREWEARRLQRRIEGRALLVKATRMDHAPDINGRQTPGEWGEGAKLSGGGKASFHIGYDDTNLYLCWNVEGQGPLKNAGGDFHRFYKTGACVDLMLSTDSQASPARTKAAAGDLRLLFTVVQGQPKAVLYQPVYKGAKPDEAWKTFTQAGGETAFDRVALLSDAKVVVSGTDSYVLEAAVPLATLGLKPKPGLRLKLDWGVQTTTDGNQVKARAYWANSLATGTADEAVEARLEPGLWGHVGFQ